MHLMRFTAFVSLLVITQACFAAPCDVEDFETRVSGTSQCLMMRRFGTTEPESMLVWLHGDVSSGGSANYHFQSAEKAAKVFEE